jgi:Ca2+-binding RTX toxin-like protein
MSHLQGSRTKLASTRGGREVRPPARYRRRPSAEALEGRALLASLVVNGDLFGPSNDTILLQRNATNANFAEVRINNIVVSNTPINTLSAITINGLEGADTINIEDTFANVPVTINGGNGNDTVNISPTAKNLAHIQGSVTFNGGAGLDTVQVNDQNNAAATTYTLTATQLTRPGAAPINYATSEGLALNGGSASDVYNVESTAAGSPVTIFSQKANDAYNVSPTARNLNTLAANLTISDAGGADALTVNDQNNAAVASYSLTSAVMIRSGPSTFQSTAFGVENVTVKGGSAADNYSVENTVAGTTQSLVGGAGNDSFVVSPTTRNLSTIAGALNVNGGGGTDSLTVDDQSNASSAVYALNSLFLSRPGSATVEYVAVENLRLNGGTATDTYNIEGTGPATTVAAGNGFLTSTTFNVAPTSQTLTGFQAPLTLIGGQGSDTVNVNDQKNPIPSIYNIAATQLNRVTLPVINYQLVSRLNFRGGSSDDTYNIESTPAAVPVAITGGTHGNFFNVSPGAHNLDNIRGPLSLVGDFSPDDKVVLNDQNNAAVTTYTVTDSNGLDTQVNRSGASSIFTAEVSGVTVNGGSASNTYKVESTSDFAPLTLVGGAGNDLFQVTPTNRNLDGIEDGLSIDGKGGNDSAILSDQAYASNGTYTVTSTQVTRTVNDVIFITKTTPASSQATVNYAGLESLTLNGGSGSDAYNVESTAATTPVTINAGANADTFQLSPTANDLTTIAGKVTVNGGGGSDLLDVDDQSGFVIFEPATVGPGPINNIFNKTYTLNATSLTRTGTGNAEVDFNGVESLRILNGAGNSTLFINAVPNIQNVTFDGNGGTDTVVGSNTSSNNFFFAFNEIGLANTSLHANGVENLRGGAFDDTFRFDAPSTLLGTIDGGGGNDTIDYSGISSGVTVNLATGVASKTSGVSNIENVFGSNGADNLTGNAADNILIGNAGNDVISGGDGNDILLGGAGNDILDGGAGRDLLIGGAGSDVLNGGAGDDILIGASTVYDQNFPNVAALQAIEKEWTRADADYLTRIGHLKGTIPGGFNGSTLLNQTKIVDDAIADLMAGGSDLDWFFATSLDSTDRATGEVLN